MRIVNVNWEGNEVYFTFKRSDGVLGELQLNMVQVVEHDSWCMDNIAWEGEENEHSEDV